MWLFALKISEKKYVKLGDIVLLIRLHILWYNSSMNAEQLDILRIIFTIVFALSGIVLVILGVKESENKKKRRLLFISGAGSLTFSIFVLSLLVESPEIRDILVSIAVISATILNGLVFGFVIVDYRQKKK